MYATSSKNVLYSRNKLHFSLNINLWKILQRDSSRKYSTTFRDVYSISNHNSTWWKTFWVINDRLYRYFHKTEILTTRYIELLIFHVFNLSLWNEKRPLKIQMRTLPYDQYFKAEPWIFRWVLKMFLSFCKSWNPTSFSGHREITLKYKK